MKPLRTAVVGCGAIHATHCDALLAIDDVKLTAVVDEVPDKAKAAGDKYSVRSAQSISEIADEVDAVHICVPSGLHCRLTEEAASHGLHVLTEKPIDVSMAHGRAMIAACRKANVRLGVVSQHRFASDVRRLRDAAQDGSMGRLIHADMYNKWYRSQAYYDSGAWRGTWDLDGGGCLMNQGVHYVDLLQWIMGGVQAVQAQVRTAAHQRIEVEDVANALVEFKNGAIGVIEASTCDYPGMSERIEVHGLHGSAVLEGDRFKVWKVDSEASQLGLYGDGVNRQPTPKLELHPAAEGEKSGGAASDPTAVWGEQHRLQIADFVQAIFDERDPFITGEAALEPLKVILAIYESGRRGGARVELDGIA